MIFGENIYFRTLEMSDKKFLLETENDVRIWHLSNTLLPFSETHIEHFIMQSSDSLLTNQQLRFVICKKYSNETLGLIDLFDFDPINSRAGIGIIIVEQNRNCGYGTESVNLICNYAKQKLRLHQLWANVLESNSISISTFKNTGFNVCGEKKDWTWVDKKYETELIFQKIL